MAIRPVALLRPGMPPGGLQHPGRFARCREPLSGPGGRQSSTSSRSEDERSSGMKGSGARDSRRGGVAHGARARGARQRASVSCRRAGGLPVSEHTPKLGPAQPRRALGSARGVVTSGSSSRRAQKPDVKRKRVSHTCFIRSLIVD